MKLVVEGINLVAFLLLLGTGGLAFKDPKKFKWLAIGSMILFTAGIAWLGWNEQRELQGGGSGWSKP